MRVIAKHLKPYSLYCLLGPLFKLLEVVFELYVPLVITELIEQGILLDSQPTIYKCAATIAALGILGFFSALLAQHFAAKASTHAVGDIKNNLFIHIQHFSFSQLESLGKSSLFSRLTSDMNQIQTAINLTLRLLLRSPFVVFGAMIMAFLVSKESAFYFVILIPILFIITFAILIYTIPLFSKSQIKLDNLVTITRENLTGTRVIRAFRHENEETEQFYSSADQLLDIQNLSSAISTILNPVTTILVNVFIVLMINNGYSLFMKGSVSQGDLLALYNYMSMILVELIKLSNLVITITKGIASAKRVEEIFDINATEEPDSVSIADNTKSETLGIVFDNVSYKYPDSPLPAIYPVSFSIDSGEVVGIIGGIGSGKSTLGHLIAGYYLPSDGTVMIFGLNPVNSVPSLIRHNISYVFQKASLISGTIRSNLCWGKNDATDEEMIFALEAAQAWSFINEKNGLETVVERDGKNFSGGQRQRLSIARALIKKPRLLILDDSASALDYITESKLRTALAKLPWHPTVVIISQRITSIIHADKILVLKNGSLVGKGTHSELINTCDEYREIALSQGMEVS